jgi:hypothetical protein
MWRCEEDKKEVCELSLCRYSIPFLDIQKIERQLSGGLMYTSNNGHESDGGIGYSVQNVPSIMPFV